MVALTIGERLHLHRDVRWRTAENLLRVIKRLPATELLDDKRVTRRRHAAGAPIGRDQKSIGILPVDGLLGVRDGETAGDEGAARGIELACDGGVLTAFGQRDQTPRGGRLVAGVALENPGMMLGFRKRIEVDQRVPVRIGQFVIIERGAAPDALRMCRILPEVDDVVGEKLGQRNTVAGLFHAEGLFVEWLIERVGLQHFQRCRIMRPHPVHRPRRIDCFQPDIRIRRLGESRCRTQQKSRNVKPHGRTCPRLIN